MCLAENRDLSYNSKSAQAQKGQGFVPVASELGFVDELQESRREERSQKRQTVVVQGRR